MLTCKQIPEVLSESNLSFKQKLQLRVHLFICDRCRQLKRQFESINKGLHRCVNKAQPLNPEIAKKIVDDYLKSKKD